MPSSRRPAKQLLFWWLEHELKRSVGAEVGLDVACGFMQFRPLFRSARYIGVEIDLERLQVGLGKYPGVTGIHSSIEELDPALQGDFVICIQTIGANKLFNSENTVLCVEKLVRATKQGGTLLVTIGPASAKYIEEIEKILRNAFRHVKIKSYGAFNRRLPSMISKIIALMMAYVPFLRRTSEPRYYFSCQGRL
jgi:hypothetical protein